MLADSLCMGCMEPKYEGRCPNPQSCGWVEGTPPQSPLQLPPRTILEQRYVLGKVLGQVFKPTSMNLCFAKLQRRIMRGRSMSAISHCSRY